VSYSLALGISAEASASIEAGAEATLPKETQIPKLPDCSDAAVTGNTYVDKTFVECCIEVKKNWHLSAGDKAKALAECGARGAATGACVAAGVVTFGITTVLAPICGDIGAFIADRVMGYSATQIVGGIVAGAACAAVSAGIAAPLCAFVAAELIGWLSDAVGPLIEGIFDPGAARRRELAARAAYHQALEANETACQEADDRYRLAWGLGVHSLKELYTKAFPTAALQAEAAKHLGFGPDYDGVAKALRAAGAATHTRLFSGNKGQHGCYGGHPTWECPGCERFDYVRDPAVAKASGSPWKGTAWQDVVESWVAEGRKDGWSDVCPFSVYMFYLTARTQAPGDKPSRSEVTKWEKSFAPQIAQVAAGIYPAMVTAISSVATAITALGAALKQQELFKAADAASKEQLTARIARAASAAEAAADAALKGSAKEGRRAVQRASEQNEIAKSAFGLLLTRYGSDSSEGARAARAAACAQDVYCKRGTQSVARAQVATQNAALFFAKAQRKRLLIGSAIVASIAGGAYMLSKR